ncbi:MAG: class I SAM-dependent methyltransferase [Sphingomonadaceae bacterium]
MPPSLAPAAVRRRYGRLARVYDAAVRAYEAVGLASHRELAVRALRLAPGDHVLDLGCGTGLNLPHLLAAVGQAGQVTGVDLSPAMLARARARAGRADWTNVTLVEADLADWEPPPGIAGALASYVLDFVPDPAPLFDRLAAVLRPGGRVALLGMQRPPGVPRWLARLGALPSRPFGVSLETLERRPWAALFERLECVEVRPLSGGSVYLAVAEAPPAPGWRASVGSAPGSTLSQSHSPASRQTSRPETS